MLQYIRVLTVKISLIEDEVVSEGYDNCKTGGAFEDHAFVGDSGVAGHDDPAGDQVCGCPYTPKLVPSSNKNAGQGHDKGSCRCL